MESMIQCCDRHISTDKLVAHSLVLLLSGRPLKLVIQFANNLLNINIMRAFVLCAKTRLDTRISSFEPNLASIGRVVSNALMP